MYANVLSLDMIVLCVSRFLYASSSVDGFLASFGATIVAECTSILFIGLPYYCSTTVLNVLFTVYLFIFDTILFSCDIMRSSGSQSHVPILL